MLNVLDYQFNGPYSINADFKELAGVYVITTSNLVIVDVGETENLKDRIPDHERRPCWVRNSGNNLYFYRESNKQTRLSIEEKIRNRYNPSCGEK